MNTTPTSGPDLARLLARLGVFLDEAESAIARAQPEALAQAAPAWAQLSRELRRLPDAQWPSAQLRREVLHQASARVSALQQAVGRAQARMAREMDLLARAETDPSQSSNHPLDSSAPPPATGVSFAGTYDASGASSNRLRTPGTYA